MKALSNDRHEHFALEYLVDLNAAAAAVRAGFKEGPGAKVTGCRLLNRPDVQSRITALMTERRQRCQIEADDVVSRLDRMARLCEQLVPKLDSNGDVIALVPVNPSGALRALELLGRHMAMFVDRVDNRMTSDTTIEIDWSASEPPSLAGREEPQP